MVRSTSLLRVLITEDKQELCQDMKESSAWAKAELKCRRVARKSKNSVHGIDDGIEKSNFSN